MNLHPGAAIALRRLDMDELGVAKAMSIGELTSPQRYFNVSLYCIRITGTGVSFRPQLNEFVYRKPENYLTQEFLDRCGGLSVIWKHPEKSLLNSKEFADRVVGSVMLSYIKDDEVWAVAKIYDDEMIKLLQTQKMSTSPAVLLGDSNQRMTLEDGSKVLIEDKAKLLDHICLTPLGIWDKGGPATGVEQSDLDGPRADSIEASVSNQRDWNPSLRDALLSLALLKMHSKRAGSSV